MSPQHRPPPAKPPKTDAPRPIATNKKAFHDLAVDYTLEAGLVLVGSEVKSLRAGHCLVQGAHARVVNGEAMLFGLTIREYAWSHQFNHEAARPRKLLLHRREIDRLGRELQAKGTTAVLARLVWVGSRVKAEIAVGSGKKAHDKRDAIKERESKRDIARAIR